MPIVLRREAAGVISAVGDDVKDWKVSDRAAVHPNDAGLATADADPIGTGRNGAYAERRRRPGNTNSSLYPTTSIPIRPLPRRTRHDRLQLPRSTVAGRLAGLGPGRLTQLAPGEPARRCHRARAGELIPSPPGSSPACDAWGTASPATTGFLVRALRWFKRRGIRVERMMTGNGAGDGARLLRKACRLLRLRNIPPGL
jgi:hypothetical protein